MEYELTPDAIELGLGTALPAMLELTIGEFGRGERYYADMSDAVQTVRFGRRID